MQALRRNGEDDLSPLKIRSTFSKGTQREGRVQQRQAPRGLHRVGTVYISDASVTVCVNLGNKIEEIETSEISPGRWFRLRRKPAKHSERDMGEGVLPQAKLQLRY